MQCKRLNEGFLCFLSVVAFTVERKEGKINMTAAEYDYDIKTMYKVGMISKVLITQLNVYSLQINHY